MKHLIDINDLSITQIKEILHLANSFDLDNSIDIFKNKLIVMLFFENSTRTKSSFEIAIKRLGGNTLSLSMRSSSISKGESIKDTIKTLDAMSPNGIIIRHSAKNLPLDIKKDLNTPIINAGSGNNSHPTQALLDLYTIVQHFGSLENIKGKKIAIVGDIKNSRVANSNLSLLPQFGIIPILVAPKCFMPKNNEFKKVEFLHEIIDEVDIIMSLRTQLERHSFKYFDSLEDFGKIYCITKKSLGARDILLLHPGPVNENIDISSDLIDDKRCKVLKQVKNGVKIRMALIKTIFATK